MLRSEWCNAKISKMWSKIIPCEKALLTFYRNYKATRSFPILKKKKKSKNVHIQETFWQKTVKKKKWVNFKKLSVSGPRLAKVFHSQAAEKKYFYGILVVPGACIDRNVYVTLYWFFIYPFYTTPKEITIKLLS